MKLAPKKLESYRKEDMALSCMTAFVVVLGLILLGVLLYMAWWMLQ